MILCLSLAFFFYFAFLVGKFFPLLDHKVLNFLSSDPITHLDSPIFSRLIIAFAFVLTLSSLKLGTDTDVSLEYQFLSFLFIFL